MIDVRTTRIPTEELKRALEENSNHCLDVRTTRIPTEELKRVDRSVTCAVA